ncbi:MAG: hypothetical protein WDN75_10555 [Bacteroidota bacterium]
MSAVAEHTQITQEEIIILGTQWGAKFRDLIPDEIIDAYQAGKKTGVEGYINWMQEKQKKSLVEAMKYSSEVIKMLQTKLDLSVTTAFLRQLSAEQNCINKTLIVINKEEYLSEKALKAYELLINRSKELRKSGVDLNFALMPEKEYNLDSLSGDGFFYEYANKKEARHA